MFAKVNSMGIFGMEVFPVSVEADISSGLPRFDVVGLPDSERRALSMTLQCLLLCLWRRNN